MNRNGNVVATKLISEENFNGSELHTHARKGDRGQVLHREEVDGVELLTVRFDRSGTVATVFPGGNVTRV